ncbi:MAG: Mov34/MPN/PAD-1 family protein [Deltaproteobacteria bacterium]|nr:Mov34/MPN/PAD-1 family protein [Deltaproteobacteria bacterium]
MNMRFVEKSGGPAIVFTDEALSAMHRYRQLNPKTKEAGGQLFAKFEGADTIIVEATTPKILDKRSRYGFKPNRMLQRLEIYNRYRKGLHFVGDWHTHPEKKPLPSDKDVSDMAKCFHLSIHNLRAFVMVIMGTASAPEGLHIALIQGRSIVHLVHENKGDGSI